jgi:uncharacterized protein (DUF2237 family)
LRKTGTVAACPARPQYVLIAPRAAAGLRKLVLRQMNGCATAYTADMKTDSPPARNVFSEPLVPCSFNPVTGFFRDGCCKTSAEDAGTHVICAVMTDEFLDFSKSRGNDLGTPLPDWGFPGLKAGDQWCLCALRWKEAYLADAAPDVILESTNYSALDIIPLEILQRFDHRGQRASPDE